MRLEVSLQAPLLSYLSDVAIHILSDQLPDGGTPVEEELLRLRRVLHDLSCQGRHPLQQTVAPALLELLWHLWSPCLPPCLIAVYQQVVQATLAHQIARGILIRIQVIIDVIRHSLLVQLRHLQARSLRRSRMVGLSRQ